MDYAILETEYHSNVDFVSINYSYYLLLSDLTMKISGRFHCKINQTQSSGIRTVSVTVNSSESTGPLFQSYLLIYACLLAGSIGHRPRNATIFCPWLSSPFLSWCIPYPSLLFPCLCQVFCGLPLRLFPGGFHVMA